MVSGIVSTRVVAVEGGKARKHEIKDNGNYFFESGIHVLEYISDETTCRLEFDDLSLMMRRTNADYTHEFTFHSDFKVTGFLKYPFGDIEASGKTYNYGTYMGDDGEIAIDLEYELNIQDEVTKYDVKFDFTQK